MDTIDAQKKVCDIVTENPKSADVFNKYRIDYCCGGKLPLAEICKQKDIDLQELIMALQQVDVAVDDTTFNIEKSSMSELVDYIERTHHRYLIQEMPVIMQLLKKVAARHGEVHTEFKALLEQFELFNVEIFEHMHKEEEVLFPLIRRLESATNSSELPREDVTNSIAALEHEHDVAGQFLAKFRHLSKEYTPFEDACPTVSVLLQKLHDLEVDMHKHVHMENHVLFPKAIAKITKN